MSKQTEPWRNAIVRYAEEAPEQLLAHPGNPKIHPKPQQDALAGAISDLGWLAPVIVNERSQHVLDGHARIGLAISRGEASIPVIYVDLDEALEAEALLTFDPIGNLAVHDKEQLDALLREVESGDAAVQQFLADLAKKEGLYLEEPQTAAVDNVPEQFMVMIECDGEQAQSELLQRLTDEGYRCRALVS